MRPFDSRPWQRAHPRLRIPDSDAISELSILSLSLSLSNRWTEPLRRCPTHNELVKLERDSIIGISMRVPAVFETWPRVLQEIASRIGRMGEKRRRRNTSAQTFGKITEGHPISTFNGNHSEREIIAFNHHRISFAIHPFLPPDIPSSLSHSLSYLSFQASFHRLERPVAARRREEYNTTSPLPPFFHTRERFGVNRNRISRERRLQAIREVFTPSCEGTSIRERGEGAQSKEEKDTVRVIFRAWRNIVVTDALPSPREE